MEVLVLGIDNSLIPVEISACNQIHKYTLHYCTVKNFSSKHVHFNISNKLTAHYPKIIC